jgi:hypothetical protein
MKRVWAHVLAALSLLAGAGTVFTACVHDDTTLYIHDVLAPKYAQIGAACTWAADPTQPAISSGVLDIAIRTRYDAMFLLANQMVAQVNPSQLQTETSTMKIDGAIVRVTNASGAQLTTYTRLAAALVPPSTGGLPGYSAIGTITVVDAPTLLGTNDPSLNNTIVGYLSSRGPRAAVVRVVTYVRFFGKTLGGQSVESNEFEFPVDICNGCLIAYANSPLYPLPNCVGATGVVTTTTQIPCFLGEDLPVDCSLCQGLGVCQGAYQPPMADAGGG